MLKRRIIFFFQAEDGIRDPLWSRGLGDVYKRQDCKGAEERKSPGIIAQLLGQYTV